MNNKDSISVIAPPNGFGGSKLITHIRLNSPGAAWVLSQDQKTIHVATPLSREVTIIDTGTWQTKTFLPFDAASARLALQPDGYYLWEGLEGAGVSVVDTDQITFTDRFACMRSTGNETVNLLSLDTLGKQLPQAGRYSVSVPLNKPPVYHCFAADIAPDPNWPGKTRSQSRWNTCWTTRRCQSACLLTRPA